MSGDTSYFDDGRTTPLVFAIPIENKRHFRMSTSSCHCLEVERRWCATETRPASSLVVQPEIDRKREGRIRRRTIPRSIFCQVKKQMTGRTVVFPCRTQTIWSLWLCFLSLSLSVFSSSMMIELNYWSSEIYLTGVNMSAASRSGNKDDPQLQFLLFVSCLINSRPSGESARRASVSLLSVQWSNYFHDPT